MSIRHLEHLFDPSSVAVIGASPREHSVGAMVWRRLRAGGFAGPCFAVNPKHERLDGEPVYRDVSALPQAPDLAVICTPPASVPGLIAALAARGTKAAVVLTAGLDAAQKQAMLDAAKPTVMRILGPNGLGLLVPRKHLNASFAPADAQPGTLAFVSQSGALLAAMLDWAQGRGIGFSQIVSLGECADVDFGDMLDFLASDSGTRAILLYIESVRDARKFMSAARAAARNKPVLVVKSGRSASGRLAAAAHSGTSAGEDIVFDAALERAGALRVDSLPELFVAAQALARFRDHAPLRNGSLQELEAVERLTLVSNGGGAGVMGADAAVAAGLPLAPLSAASRAALDEVLPPGWSRANPVDIMGDAPPERYVQALRILLDDAGAGTLLLMHAPTAIVPSLTIAQALLPLVQASRERLAFAWLGGPAVAEARALIQREGVPCHDTPEDAVHAHAMLAAWRRNQAQLMEAPPALPAAGLDLGQVRELIAAALREGRTMLGEPRALAVLKACGIPVVQTRAVKASPKAASLAATEIGFPVVLKIRSPQVAHKGDVGGVALALADEAAVASAARAMLKRVRKLRPDALIEGFTVQAMVKREGRPHAIETVAGAQIDALFGPVILFGAGGASVEVLHDRAVALPPLNKPLARWLVRQTRVARLLAGRSDVPAADLDALCGVLEALSTLMAEVPQIAGIEIEPLLVDAQGVIALNARISVDAAGPGGARHFAIRPYPREWAEQRDWQGRLLTLRPIRPEDEARHLEFLGKVDPADIRMRVFYSRRSIERSELARLTQIDDAREMAFVATAADANDANDEPGREETLAVARAITDPDNQDAEFGILVRSDLKGSGLGSMLMKKLIAYQRAQGTQRLVATVLHENTGMLALARRLGFEADSSRDAGDGVQAIYLGLN